MSVFKVDTHATHKHMHTEDCWYWALLHSTHSHGIFWEFELENIKDISVLHQIDWAEVGHETLQLRGGKKREEVLRRIKSENLSLINTLVRVHKQAFHGSNLPDYISGCSSLNNEPHKAQPRAWGRQSDYPKSMALLYSITSTSSVWDKVWQTAQEVRTPLWPYPLCPLLLVYLLCQKGLQLLLNRHQLLWIHPENELKTND